MIKKKEGIVAATSPTQRQLSGLPHARRASGTELAPRGLWCGGPIHVDVRHGANAVGEAASWETSLLPALPVGYGAGRIECHFPQLLDLCLFFSYPCEDLASRINVGFAL